MADLILKVDPAQVRAKAGEINTQKQLMESLMTEMKSKVNELNQAWDSESGKSYVEKYTNVTKEIQDSLNALQQHITNLNEAASKYEEMENAQTQQINALNTQDIF
jgi:WXG100 family type VII secretion target